MNIKDMPKWAQILGLFWCMVFWSFIASKLNFELWKGALVGLIAFVGAFVTDDGDPNDYTHEGV